jgi:hypothetical protein
MPLVKTQPSTVRSTWCGSIPPRPHVMALTHPRRSPQPTDDPSPSTDPGTPTSPETNSETPSEPSSPDTPSDPATPSATLTVTPDGLSWCGTTAADPCHVTFPATLIEVPPSPSPTSAAPLPDSVLVGIGLVMFFLAALVAAQLRRPR